MAKRPADQALDETVPIRDSPSTKKARLGSSVANGQSNGASTSSSSSRTAIPTRQRPGPESISDIPDAASPSRQIQDELQQAATTQTPPDNATIARGENEEDDGDENEGDDEDVDVDTVPVQAPARQSRPTEGYQDLYLDTINRAVLDFDFEKLCSISLSNMNVYACLVCGRYFQGRGPKSHAYFHALEIDHHVFINLESKRVYVLPEGYEVDSKSLDDIKFVVDPHLARDEVLLLDKTVKDAWDLAGKPYRPGFVGMNNIKANDYFNVIIQALAHIPPLRNFFMLEDLSSRSELVRRCSVLVRKIWNTHAFKTHVSPHELLQQVSRQSHKRFDLLTQSDPVDFLSWFLNNLHLALGGSRTKPGSSIIHKIFQGKVKIESQNITTRSDADDRLRFEEAAETDVETSRYLMLTLDLPPAPLFQDELDKNIIPQVSLSSLLSKYDGLRTVEQQSARRRYRLVHPLPPYLLFHIKRFSQNQFISERNPTIVTFQPRALDMSPFVEPNPLLHPPGEPIWYDLVANVTHEAVRVRDDSVEGEAEKKVWRVQLRDRAADEWLDMQDLYQEKASAETLFTREAYLMVWERRKTTAKKQK